MIHQTLGDRLKYSLEIRNMKQTEFAEKIGVTATTVHRYINDERIPNADAVIQMCRVLGVSADWLLGMLG